MRERVGARGAVWCRDMRHNVHRYRWLAPDEQRGFVAASYRLCGACGDRRGGGRPYAPGDEARIVPLSAMNATQRVSLARARAAAAREEGDDTDPEAADERRGGDGTATGDRGDAVSSSSSRPRQSRSRRRHGDANSEAACQDAAKALFEDERAAGVGESTTTTAAARRRLGSGAADAQQRVLYVRHLFWLELRGDELPPPPMSSPPAAAASSAASRGGAPYPLAPLLGGGNGGDTVYINIVRHPVRRFVSLYYYEIERERLLPLPLDACMAAAGPCKLREGVAARHAYGCLRHDTAAVTSCNSALPPASLP